MYKFRGYPKWMIGASMPQLDGSVGTITEDEINHNCKCYIAIQSHMCMMGHMTECHAGMTCREAECSHYISSQWDE